MRQYTLPVLFLLAACSGGDDVTTSSPSATSMLVTGAPLSPMLVGNTTQLTAVPVNASGGVVSNLTIDWKTNDPAVAVVSSSGVVTAAGPGTATISAVSGRAEGTARFDVRAGGAVTTAGATLSILNGALTLLVSPFTFAQTTTVMVGYAPSPPVDARLVPGTAYEIGPDDLPLLKPLTLSLRYDASRIPNDLAEASLQLYTVNTGKWRLVGGSAVDPATHTVTGFVWNSGVYAVMSTPVNSIVITGAQVDGSMLVGQTGSLTALLYDADHTALSGRTVSWSTSDASKVTVDGAGKVTAVAPGTASLKASVDGKTATTIITVLTSTVADWTGAQDWTTYQGTASHTGYVPVVADPGVFKELWSTSVGPVALNPVTTGAGLVYVSTNVEAGLQVAKAFDARTGVERWSHDFGELDLLNPPAFDNGTVYLQTGGYEDSFLWGLDAASGSVRFSTPYDNSWLRWYAPTVVNSTVYAGGSTYGGMLAFGASDGSPLWAVALDQYQEFTPAVANGFVYAYTDVHKPKLSVVEAATGKVSYEIPDPGFTWDARTTYQAPVLGGTQNILLTNGGRLLSFNLVTRTIGYQIHSTVLGQVTVGNGVVYVRNGKSIEARKESDGALAWSWTPPGGQQVSGTTVVTKNLLFVGTPANTYALDLASHKQIWSYPAGGLLAVSKEGILFIAQQNGGKLIALSLR